MQSSFIRITALLVAAAILNGCGGKEPAASKPITVAPKPGLVVAPPPRAGSMPTATPGVTVQLNDAPEDAALRQILTKYFNEQAQPAQGWEELLARKYISKIPTGPDGKPQDWAATMQRLGKASVSPR